MTEHKTPNNINFYKRDYFYLSMILHGKAKSPTYDEFKVI